MSNSKLKLKYIIILILAVFLFSLTSVFLKIASGYQVLSFEFIFMYGLAILNMIIYAVIWQRVLLHVDISIAYNFKAMSIIYALMWSVIIFKETITINNIIGVMLIVIGIIVGVRNEL